MSLQSQNAVCGHMETDDAPCNCYMRPLGLPVEPSGTITCTDTPQQWVAVEPWRQGGQVTDPVISTDLTVDEAMWAKWQAGRQKYGEEFVGDPIQELYAEYIDALNYFNEIERRGLLTADLVYARLSTRRLAELVRTEARR